MFGFEVGDEFGAAYAMVLIDQSGFAKQAEIARAFCVTPRTVQRNLQRYKEDGPTALGQGSGWKKGRSRLPRGIRARATSLHLPALTKTEIGLRLGISRQSVAQLLAAEGIVEPARISGLLMADEDESMASEAATDAAESGGPAEEERSSAEARELAADQEAGSTFLPELSAALDVCGKAGAVAEGTQAPAEEQAPESPGEGSGSTDPGDTQDRRAAPWSLDVNPANRAADRMLANVGLLEDAVPMFRSGERVAGAGVLLAVPALEASGVLDAARQVYGSLSPSFYGLAHRS